MNAMNFCCPEMESAVADLALPIDYFPKWREYGVRLLDGGSSHLNVTFCPWCGQALPRSLRDEWFDNLERLGVDPYGDEIPSEFTDARWYAAK